jgi:predicted flap endonuclease-1-like 5' DNA nuclease
MATAITDLRGMTDAMLAECKAQNIKDVDQLTDTLATPAARKQWAAKVGVVPQDILTLANRADLSRINGIGGAFSDLLEEAGVDTVKELSHRRPDNLHEKMVQVNAEKKLTAREPSLSQCAGWVDQAKALGGKITY